MSAETAPPNNHPNYDLFLSYNTKDRAAVLQIRERLKQFGIASFLDCENLTPGLPWREALEKAIAQQARAAAIFLGSDGYGRTHIAEKDLLLDRAESAQKNGSLFPVVPIILPGGPDQADGFLSRYTWIDLRNGLDDEETIRRLAAAVLRVTLPEASSPQRKLELDYLDRLQEEEELNQERQARLYTNLEGRAQKRRPEVRAAYERRSAREGEPLPPKQVDDAIAELVSMRQAVLLGEPGSGKTTTLCLLTANLLEAARENPQAPLPLLIRLGRWTEAEQSLSAFIAAQVGDLGAHLETLLKDKRAALLLDGLNELPVNQRVSKYPQVQKFIQTHKELLAVVSCRALDYTLDLKFDTINILPLDPLRIREFVKRDLGDEQGEQMFWELAGDETQRTYQEFMQQFAGQLSDPEQTFWNEPELPSGVYWGFDDKAYKYHYWEQWLRLRETPSSLMLMARNPYLLSMLDAEFADAGKLPDNRGELFRAFVNRLLKREREFLTDETEQDALQREQDALIPVLAQLAFEMQSRRSKNNEGGALTALPKADALRILNDRQLYLAGFEMQSRHSKNDEGGALTALPKAEALRILNDRQLYLAGNASLLNTGELVRFSHQLLQEYFAAKFMDIEYQAGRLSATQIWPREHWWERTNWEESAVLWAGLYTDDCTAVVNWLAEANPEVAAQCIVRSGSYTPDATKADLRARWTPRLTDLRREPKPLARAALGRALGLIGDTRTGVGVKNGLPDIDWVEIPGGEFQYGDKKPKKIDRLRFGSAVIPSPTHNSIVSRRSSRRSGCALVCRLNCMTMTGGWRNSDSNITNIRCANHPREMVNWYQAMAFCRWLSWRLGAATICKALMRGAYDCLPS
ncbi:MAG: TIR domain-containing protein [Blastocatellia bacterium]